MMGKWPEEGGKPTASKMQGAAWYYPAVTVAYGRPRRIDGERFETRGQAIKAARAILKEREADAIRKGGDNG